jgi:hypothetical protein
MTQAQIDRAVARATGESIALIRSLGFSELCLPVVVDCPEKGSCQINGRRKLLPISGLITNEQVRKSA